MSSMPSSDQAIATLDRPIAIRQELTQTPFRSWDGPRCVVIVLCLGSAILALILSRTMFAHLSVNNDESAYLLQAKAIAHGQLFPVAPHPAASFTPWLGVIRDGHYVLKYAPVVGA